MVHEPSSMNAACESIICLSVARTDDLLIGAALILLMQRHLLAACLLACLPACLPGWLGLS